MFGFKRKAPPPAPSADEWRRQGNAALERGDLGEAQKCYRRAAEAGDVPAHVNLGYVLLQCERAAEAEAWLQRAVGSPGVQGDTLADAHYLLALCRQSQNRHELALESLLAALAARPAFDEALATAVALLIERGRAAQALTLAQRACAAGATPVSLMLLAQSQHACGEPEAALATLQSLLAREPGHAEALETRGSLLMELARPAEALANYEQVLAVHGRRPDTLSNRAAALLRLGRAEEALASVDEALRLAPAHRIALHARGQALLALMRLQEAREFAVQASLAHPGDGDLEWNRAVAHLLLGEFEAGWAAHESRRKAAGFERTAIASASGLPRWTGAEPLDGMTLLVEPEQGLGDAIQFLRFVPLAAQRAREVQLQLPAALERLSIALPPNCRIVPAGAAPQADRACSLLSLPHALRLGAPPPGVVPYIRADDERVAYWRARLAGSGPAVGITWSGNPGHLNDHNRSIALRDFLAVAGAPVRLVNLQPQVRDSDRDALARSHEVLDAGRELKDFGETAALVEALDLVVSVDTSVAHLAGAMGKPVWILLPYSPDWRWTAGRDDSPWYPTARLYRQESAGAWGPVLARVRRDLERLASSASTPAAQ